MQKKTITILAIVAAALVLIATALLIINNQNNKVSQQGNSVTTGTDDPNKVDETLDVDLDLIINNTNPAGGSETEPVQPGGSGDLELDVTPTQSDSNTDSTVAPSQPGSNTDTNTGSNTDSTETPTQPEATEPQYTVTLKDYEAMTPDEQLQYMNSFPSMMDYIAWLQWAQDNDTEDGEHIEIGEGGVVQIPTNP